MFGFQHSSVYIHTFRFCLQYQHNYFSLSNCYILNVFKILFAEYIVLFHPLKCFVTRSTSSIITFQKAIIRLLLNSSVAKSDLIIGIFETGFSGELPPKVCSCSSKQGMMLLQNYLSTKCTQYMMNDEKKTKLMSNLLSILFWKKTRLIIKK